MNSNSLARILKRQRLSIPLTLRELAAKSGVSESHLGRVEREERFPSARILRKVAKPLGFAEHELLILAGYLSAQSPIEAESRESYSRKIGLDPYVAERLAQEPVEVQRAILGILNMLRSLAKSGREK